MSVEDQLGDAESTYLRQLRSYLHDLDPQTRDELIDELATELATKPPASDVEMLVADLGPPDARAERLRAEHHLAPPRRRAPATLAGAALLVVAALAAIGLAFSWWLTYELDVSVDGFAVGYGEILDPTGFERRTDGDREQIMVGYRTDEDLVVLVELTNLDSRALSLTAVTLPPLDLGQLREVRWRWIAPSQPADVVPLDRLRLETDGDRTTARLLLTIAVGGCERVAEGDTNSISAIELHYDALGRSRTTEIELPAELLIRSPGDRACPERA